jgi:hypothetical protein
VASKFNLLLHAKLLSRLSASSADPDVAAALIRRAAALSAEADSLDVPDPDAAGVKDELAKADSTSP